MAELDTSGGGKKNGKGRVKKPMPRIDLTAMVDLGFLLITFFMLTTTLSKPQAMDLAMPDKDDKTHDELPVKASSSLTLLLGSHDKIEWYLGEAGKSAPTIDNYGKDGLRRTLMEKARQIKASTGSNMVVLIKPSDKSAYKNVVDVLDEMNIANVQSYAIVDITAAEIQLLKKDGLY